MFLFVYINHIFVLWYYISLLMSLHPKNPTLFTVSGDILLTCFGSLSRNRRVGVRLGKGDPFEERRGWWVNSMIGGEIYTWVIPSREPSHIPPKREPENYMLKYLCEGMCWFQGGFMYIEGIFSSHFDCIWIPKLAGWRVWMGLGWSAHEGGCGRSLKGYFHKSSPENLDQTKAKSICVYMHPFFFYLRSSLESSFLQTSTETIDFQISEFFQDRLVAMVQGTFIVLPLLLLKSNTAKQITKMPSKNWAAMKNSVYLLLCLHIQVKRPMKQGIRHTLQ